MRRFVRQRVIFTDEEVMAALDSVIITLDLPRRMYGKWWADSSEYVIDCHAIMREVGQRLVGGGLVAVSVAHEPSGLVVEYWQEEAQR